MKNSIETECWKPVPGFENYEASDLGRIRSLNYRGNTGKTKVLNPGISRGYYRINLCKDGKKKGFYIHSLIYAAFKGPIPLGMHVNHRNEIKTDNRLSNLEVVTAKQNCNYGTRNERIAKAHLGKKHSAATKEKMRAVKTGRKLSAEHRAKIRAGLKARREREKNQE